MLLGGLGAVSGVELACFVSTSASRRRHDASRVDCEAGVAHHGTRHTARTCMLLTITSTGTLRPSERKTTPLTTKKSVCVAGRAAGCEWTPPAMGVALGMAARLE